MLAMHSRPTGGLQILPCPGRLWSSWTWNKRPLWIATLWTTRSLSVQLQGVVPHVGRRPGLKKSRQATAPGTNILDLAPLRCEYMLITCMRGFVCSLESHVCVCSCWQDGACIAKQGCGRSYNKHSRLFSVSTPFEIFLSFPSFC